VPYFGNEETINLNDNRKLTRTDEVQIAYNFPYMPALWASMVTENKEHFWKTFSITPKIPDSSAWATFLRVHDELTLEMVDEKTRKIIYNKLAHKGGEFRKGFGIGGRMADFLDKNPKRIELAFATLFSLPGIPIIYYGDEIGALNNSSYAKQTAKKREQAQKAKGLELLSYFDARDINRGPLLKNDLYNTMKETKGYHGEIYHLVKNLIKVRKQSPALTVGSLTEVKSDKYNIFSYLRQFDTEKVLVVDNLSGRKLTTTISLPENIMIDAEKAKSFVDMISNKKVQADLKGNTLKLTLKPYQALWIKL